jgi:phosphoribosylanthranilate isomerase
MTRAKICGIHTRDGLEASVRAGADAVGFVVEYPDPVPWNIDREEARRLMEQVPPFVSRVLVTTGRPETIVELARDVRPDVVQLHGEESRVTVEAVTAALESDGIGVLKAVSIAPDGDEREHRTTVEEFVSTGIDGIVLDAEADGRQGGGTGTVVSWKIAREIVAETSGPVVLAGGLTPENVGEATATVNPYAVDVISGVEGDDHRKDPDRIEAFVRAVR